MSVHVMMSDVNPTIPTPISRSSEELPRALRTSHTLQVKVHMLTGLKFVHFSLKKAA